MFIYDGYLLLIAIKLCENVVHFRVKLWYVIIGIVWKCNAPLTETLNFALNAIVRSSLFARKGRFNFFIIPYQTKRTLKEKCLEGLNFTYIVNVKRFYNKRFKAWLAHGLS